MHVMPRVVRVLHMGDANMVNGRPSSRACRSCRSPHPSAPSRLPLFISTCAHPCGALACPCTLYGHKHLVSWGVDHGGYLHSWINAGNVARPCLRDQGSAGLPPILHAPQAPFLSHHCAFLNYGCTPIQNKLQSICVHGRCMTVKLVNAEKDGGGGGSGHFAALVRAERGPPRRT